MIKQSAIEFINRRHYVACDGCYEGTQQRDAHLVATGDRETPVLVLCDSCYQEYLDELAAQEAAHEPSYELNQTMRDFMARLKLRQQEEKYDDPK